VRELAARLIPRSRNETLADLHRAVAVCDVNAGRLTEAEENIDAARVASHDPARAARLDVLAAQVVLARFDAEGAIELARRATTVGDGPTRCEALQVIGRVERLRDIEAADRAFTEARTVAKELGLGLWEIQALQELGTIDLYTTLSPLRLVEALREATSAGAVSTTAVVNLQLAAMHGERHELDACVAAARRCQEVSRRFGLATLPMAIRLEATGHGKAGRRPELEDAAERARATGDDTSTVEATLWGLAWGSFHLHRNDRAAALDALRRSMRYVDRSGNAGFPFCGLWALLATVLDAAEGEAARSVVRTISADTPTSRAMARAAEAIALGDVGRGKEAEQTFADVERVLGRFERCYRLHLTRWLVAPRAHRAGWGDAESWLRAALAGFEGLGIDGLARACRDDLRSLGVAVPRSSRDTTVPASLISLGVTGREFDVLRLVDDGLGNREIATRLFVSPRTVEKHVENLKMKTQRDRAGLAILANDAALR
jgi:DNA-binding CsgD family transcriptional regulator